MSSRPLSTSVWVRAIALVIPLCVVAASELPGAGPAAGQSAAGLPTVGELIDRLRTGALNVPRYTVTVQARLERVTGGAPSNAGDLGEKTSGAGVEPTRGEFDLSWDGRRTAASRVRRQAPQEAPAGAGKWLPTDILLTATVELEAFLPQLGKWAGVGLCKENLDGRACYAVRGASPGDEASFSLWVDAEHHYLTKATVRIRGKDFCTVTISRRVCGAGLWLPSEIVFDYPGVALRVVQSFGDYVF